MAKLIFVIIKIFGRLCNQKYYQAANLCFGIFKSIVIHIFCANFAIFQQRMKGSEVPFPQVRGNGTGLTDILFQSDKTITRKSTRYIQRE